MGAINVKELASYIDRTVELSIQDFTGEEQRAPFLKKSVERVALCPDKTHVRIYFDDRNFFAIPLFSDVSTSEKEWVAFDETSKLYYVIREVDNHE